MDLDETCAMELRALAARPELSSRAGDLESLADEVASEDADSWVGINLIAAFPVHATPTSERPRLERRLAYVATLLVFSPIAWTWWSFREASKSYRDLINSGQVGEGTFLSLWATGFGGSVAWWHQLIFVAMMSFALIVLAAVLITYQRVVATTNQRREMETYGQLAAALVTAQRLLNMRRSDDPTRVDSMLKRFVQHIDEGHRQMLSSARELGAATYEVTATMAPLLASLKDATTEVRATADECRRASEMLASASALSHDGVQRTAKEFTNGVNAALDRLRVDADAILTNSANSSLAVQTSTQQAVTTVAASLEGLTRAQVGLGQRIDDLAGSNSRLGVDVSGSIERFSAAFDGWEAAMSRHASASQLQASEITAANEMATRLLNSMLSRSAGETPGNH